MFDDHDVDFSESDDRMVHTLERIAKDLEHVIIGIGACTGLLFVIACLMLLRVLGVGG